MLPFRMDRADTGLGGFPRAGRNRHPVAQGIRTPGTHIPLNIVNGPRHPRPRGIVRTRQGTFIGMESLFHVLFQPLVVGQIHGRLVGGRTRRRTRGRIDRINYARGHGRCRPAGRAVPLRVDRAVGTEAAVCTNLYKILFRPTFFISFLQESEKVIKVFFTYFCWEDLKGSAALSLQGISI